MSTIPRGEKDTQARLAYLEHSHQVNGRWVYKPIPGNQNPTAVDMAEVFTQLLGVPVTAGNMIGLAKLTKRINKRVPAKPKGPKTLISMNDVLIAVSQLTAEVREVKKLLDNRDTRTYASPPRETLNGAAASHD